MIRLIHSLPFPVDSESLSSLRKDWTRFQDGLVILSEIPDAIRGEYECEAEVLKQDNGDEANEDNESSSSSSDNDNDTNNDTLFDTPFDTLIPSGNGKLILTAR